MSSTYNYSGLVPSGAPANQEIVQFFEAFYRVSDDPSAHQAWVDNFTSDATFKLANSSGTGTAEITQLRKGMWKGVASRHHTVFAIYPFGSNWDQVMLHGSVAHGTEDGKKAERDWAGRADLVKNKDSGKWQFSYYQVYVDRSPSTN